MNLIKNSNGLETILMIIFTFWILGLFISLLFRNGQNYWNGTGDVVARIWRNAWQVIIGIAIGYFLFKFSVPIFEISFYLLILWLLGLTFAEHVTHNRQQYQDRSRNILRNSWQYLLGVTIGYFLSSPWLHTSLLYN